MIIPDVELKKLVEQGYLPEGLNIGPSSVDLTLADSFSWPAPKQDQIVLGEACLLYTSPSPRDKRQSRMPSSA